MATFRVQGPKEDRQLEATDITLADEDGGEYGPRAVGSAHSPSDADSGEPDPGASWRPGRWGSSCSGRETRAV